MDDKSKKSLLSLLSLMQRAGKLQSGEFQSETAVKTGKAFLVIVAEDASDNTKKLFNDKCSFYNVPIVFFGLKEELGHAIGKEERSSVAIIDEGFSKSFQNKMLTLEKITKES
ncbi:MAG: ribosomal L7Ae/L30e/S12e/Gadd45 family protein [Lachnospiraceae bacterium]|nr:ribosomal L7Ae/L30e/S12e/Gadd45 family protein [Lachnospiraceae bacterium]